MIEQLLIGFLFATGISVSSYLLRFLTLSGSIAQCILGTILLGLGGWQWTVPMLVFFIFSSVISKLGKRRRVHTESLFEKSSRRDVWQVIANGGVAGAITLAWFFTRYELLYVAYLGSIAAATADTWGTEIGTFSGSSPILITTFKKVEAGRSGAISLLGLFAGFLGSGIIWMSHLPWANNLTSGFLPFLFVVGGGICGSIIDSILGATFQIQYKCSICGRITERAAHCEKQSLKVSGIGWMKNDQVNLICTFVGAIISFGLFSLFS